MTRACLPWPNGSNNSGRLMSYLSQTSLSLGQYLKRAYDFCGNNIETPQKIKNSTTIWSDYSTSGYLSKGCKNGHLKKYIHPYVHPSILYYNSDMENT